MILNDNAKVGRAKVYMTNEEMRLDLENIKLKSALKITLESYQELADDEEDERFIEHCRGLINSKEVEG